MYYYMLFPFSVKIGKLTDKTPIMNPCDRLRKHKIIILGNGFLFVFFLCVILGLWHFGLKHRQATTSNSTILPAELTGMYMLVPFFFYYSSFTRE